MREKRILSQCKITFPFKSLHEPLGNNRLVEKLYMGYICSLEYFFLLNHDQY